MWDKRKGGAVSGRGAAFTCVMLNCMAMLIGGHKTLGQLRSTSWELETERMESEYYAYLNIN